MCHCGAHTMAHLCRMGRCKRPYHPGMIFHLVSRTHRREPWFTPDLRTEIAGLIRRIIPRSDARLLSYAVMPNHLHIILRQGRAELAGVMQPLLRRLALRVQHHHGFEGGVVERRFRDRPCVTPDHVRDAIIYTHLNPWRAEICGDDLAYPWTSHGAYLPGADPMEYGIRPEVQLQILELFADSDLRSRDELCERYLRLLEWRMRADEYRAALAAGAPPTLPPARPTTDAGERAWAHFAISNGGPRAHRSAAEGQGEGLADKSLPGLRDFILAQIDRFAPGLSIATLRGSWCPRSTARVRIQLIRAAAERGFRTGVIARFFDISPQSVSRAKFDVSKRP